jgi:hypothetical protein
VIDDGRDVLVVLAQDPLTVNGPSSLAALVAQLAELTAKVRTAVDPTTALDEDDSAVSDNRIAVESSGASPSLKGKRCVEYMDHIQTEMAGELRWSIGPPEKSSATRIPPKPKHGKKSLDSAETPPRRSASASMLRLSPTASM